MSEVYKDGIYNQFLQGKKDLTIVDIGANIGVTTYWFSQFAKNVYSVEPSQEHFTVLTKMINFNELKNVTPLQRAIYIKRGKYPMFEGEIALSPNRSMFSLHQGVSKSGKIREMVECITIKDLFKMYKIEHVDLLKVDIEGTEVELFSHSSFKNISDKVDVIITERHSWTDRHPKQLELALKDAGFRIEKAATSADVIIARK